MLKSLENVQIFQKIGLEWIEINTFPSRKKYCWYQRTKERETKKGRKKDRKKQRKKHSSKFYN
jgi:hypothetical protein